MLFARMFPRLRENLRASTQIDRKSLESAAFDNSIKSNLAQKKYVKVIVIHMVSYSIGSEFKILTYFSIPTGRLRFAIYIVYLEKSGELVNLKKSAEMQECPCQRLSCSKCNGRCKKV